MTLSAPTGWDDSLHFKEGLEQAAGLSPLYAYAWSGLRQCDPRQQWLIIWEAGPENASSLERDGVALWRLSQG